jgi:sporulation integral membrane protein YlbJ
MKSRRWVAAACFTLLILMLWLVLDPDTSRQAVTEGLALCGRTAIPSLFPFFVVSSLLISLGFGELASRPMEWLMQPLFRVDGAGASALILGLAGGYPLGPRTTALLYQEGLLSKPEAHRLLTFCNNANPAFLISVLGVGVFGSVRLGIWLWLIHLLSSLLVGLVFRGWGRETPTASFANRRFRAVSLPQAFVSAVGSGLQSMLGVCSFVIFFYVLATPLRALGGTMGAALTGVLELFSATPMLPADRTGFVLAAALAGWGGLSVQCQTLAVLSGSGLSFRPCLVGKLLQSLFSAGLALLALPWLFG